MSLLTPWTALLAAAVAVPALLLLYVLKLRRRYTRIASTLLWRKSFEDLEVNTPFQRLRITTLFLVQLLALAALLMAMARPIAQGEAGASGRLILVIDRSASMNAVDGGDGITRLDEAKAAAMDIIDRLGRAGGASQVMVIAYGRNAHVVSGFQFDRSVLRQAVQGIEPTDEAANLDAALQLAAAFAGDSEESGAQSGDVVLISDGVVAQPGDGAGFRLRAGSFQFVQVGPDPEQPVSNLGIASFSARRDFEDPARVLVFGRVVNASEQDVEAVMTLDVDGEPDQLKRVTVPAASDDAPGEVAVTFELDIQRQAVLSLRHGHRDVLAVDDAASLVLPAPTQPRVAIVHGGARPDRFTLSLISDMQPRELTTLTQEEFDALDVQTLDAGDEFDLIVFDSVSNQRLPSIASLTFGGVPRGLSATAPRRDGGRRVLSWDRQHPIMRHVELDTLVYAGFGGYELPPGATPLAVGPDGPVMAVLGTRGARHVIVGFDLSSSNWPLHVSIAVFVQNVFDFVTLTDSGQVGLVHQPGDAISVRPGSGVDRLTVTGAGQTLTVPAQPGVVRTLPPLRRAGVYEVAGAGSPMDIVAVSTLSDVESDARPRGQVLVNAQRADAERGSRIVPRELWPWFVAAAFVLLMVEWLMYCRRVSA